MPASRSKVRDSIRPIIEMLEERRLRSADLGGVFASALPAELQINSNHAAIRVTNDGDSSAAGKVTVDLFAMPASGQVGDEVLLGSVTQRVNLRPGHGSNFQLRFAEPTNAPTGSYTLFAQIDPSASNASAKENIVTGSSPVSIQQPFADLTTEHVKAPNRPIFIDDTSVYGQPASAVLVNRGTGPADGTVTVNFYVSADNRLDSSDVLIGSAINRSIALKPGRSQQFTALLDPPAGMPAGYYFLFADATPISGIVQNNVGHEVALAAKEVQILRSVPPFRGTPQDTTNDTTDYTGPMIECVAGETGTVLPGADTPICPTPSPTTYPASQPATDDFGDSGTTEDSAPAGATTQPVDEGSQSPPDTTQPSDDSASQDPSADGGTQDASGSTQDPTTDPAQENPTTNPIQADPSTGENSDPSTDGQDPTQTGDGQTPSDDASSDGNTSSDPGEPDMGSSDSSGGDSDWTPGDSGSTDDSGGGTDFGGDYSDGSSDDSNNTPTDNSGGDFGDDSSSSDWTDPFSGD